MNPNVSRSHYDALVRSHERLGILADTLIEERDMARANTAALRDEVDTYSRLVAEKNRRIDTLQAALASALRACDDRDDTIDTLRSRLAAIALLAV